MNNNTAIQFFKNSSDKIVTTAFLQSLLRPIGQPIRTPLNSLNDDEIWLEGATVSRTTYSALFAVYGTTYGAGDGSTTFQLPDYRNRVSWGSSDFGYVEASLPNITGHIDYISTNSKTSGLAEASGAFSWDTNTESSATGGTTTVYGYNLTFNAANSNSIYGSSNTVQPPAIKERVKTRFK